MKIFLIKKQTFSNKGTPKIAKPMNRDIQPFYYTLELNPKVAGQLKPRK